MSLGKPGKTTDGEEFASEDERRQIAAQFSMNLKSICYLCQLYVPKDTSP
jgi:hypothetical protein